MQANGRSITSGQRMASKDLLITRYFVSREPLILLNGHVTRNGRAEERYRCAFLKINSTCDGAITVESELRRLNAADGLLERNSFVTDF